MSARRLIVYPVLAALCMLAGLGSPAFAEKIYYPGISIGEPGSGPGQLKEPVGVAVNDNSSASHVYVADKGNDRVVYFNAATGVFEGEFNGSGLLLNEGREAGSGGLPHEIKTGRFSTAEAVAVDNDKSSAAYEDVYVVDKGHLVIDRFSATGMYEGQLTGVSCVERKGKEAIGAPSCQTDAEFFRFKSVRGVAVDAAGNLWVYGGFDEEGAYILEFDASGSFMREFPAKAFAHNNQAIAVDSEKDIFVGAGIDDEISKLTEEGALIKEFSRGVNALAIVPFTSKELPDDLLADRGNVIARYGRSGEPYAAPLEEFPICGEAPKGGCPSESNGLAVSASATIYASELSNDKVQSFAYVSVPVVTIEAPSGVTETGLTLHGSVNPAGEGLKECYFEYGTQAGRYTGEKLSCKPSAAEITGTKAVPVSAVASNLLPTGVRSFHLVAVNTQGVPQESNGLVGRPTTTDETASEIGSETARVSAQVNAGGLASCYWIEYGPSNSYGGRMPKEKCITVGVGEGIRVSAEVSGLRPNTRYYFRVGASNALGPKFGEGGTFATFGPSAAELPDERVAEAVSAIGEGNETEVYVPDGMRGTLDDLARHGIFTNLPFEASADGDMVTYIGDPPTSGGNGNEGVGGGNQYVATREPRGGWTPGVSINAPGYANDYDGFSDDLSVGILGSPEHLAEDAPVGYSNLYRRSIGWRPTSEESLEPLPGSFEPLFTTSPCLPANEFGSLENNALAHEVIFDGGNAGTDTVAVFSHLLFEADAELPSSPPTEACRAGNDLYDWFGGWRYLVNVLPNGRTEPSATFGRQGPSTNGFVSPGTSDAISADGSRIYWSAVEAVKVGGEYEERPKALYVRENDTQAESEIEGEQCVEPAKACTVQVDASALPGTQSKKDAEGGGGQFWTASSDGSRVLFTDEKRLTAGSTAEAGDPDLYEYDLGAPEGERLNDLSISGKPEPGAHADVQGVVGTSDEGSYVYFVADGVLAEGAAPGDCDGQDEASQTCNLYVRHDGTTKFIATLSGEDGDFTHGTGGNDGDWQADPGHRTAEVTPDGHSVVFMSRRPLTGYDNVLEGVPLTEVFVYNTETDRIVCASCNPSGESPVVPSLPEYAKNIAGIWGSFLPVSDSLDDYQPRLISEDGDRVFFNSIESLVPQAENGLPHTVSGLLNVYEWEAQGEGSCREEGGCVYLLSGGQSTDNSYLIDASANGSDVFFVSRAQLVTADHGDNDVLYDARVGGVKSPAEGECLGAGCQGASPASPIFATPASVTFDGTGNFPLTTQHSEIPPPPKCAKNKKLSRGKCVKKTKPKGKRAKKKPGRASRRRKKSRAARTRIGAEK
jgi:hypothetical protein